MDTKETLRRILFNMFNGRLSVRTILKMAFYALIIEFAVIIMWYLWRYKGKLWLLVPAKAAAIWALIATKLYLWVLLALAVIVVIGGLAWLSVIVWRKVHKPLIWKYATAFGLALTLICVSTYLLKAVDVVQPNAVISMQKVRFYSDSGLFGSSYHREYTLTPTSAIKPDTVYQFSIKNGIVNWQDSLIWTQYELTHNKPYVIKQTISQEEYDSLNQVPIDTKIYQVQIQHNWFYLTIPLMYGMALVLIATYNRIPLLWRKRNVGVAIVRY